MTYNKISQDKYDKARGQLKIQTANVLDVFNCYGMGIHIKDITEECVHLAEQFAMRVRGKDIPIKLRNKLERPTE